MHELFKKISIINSLCVYFTLSNNPKYLFIYLFIYHILPLLTSLNVIIFIFYFNVHRFLF